MPKPSALSARLERLDAMIEESPSPEGLRELKRSLEHKNNHTVAHAAAVAKSWKANTLAQELAAAFRRFLEKPVATDPGCAAKIAIVEALREFDEPRDDLYLIGLRYVQKEPAWGAPDDTAAPLRGYCAQALAATNYPAIHLELTTLIMDAEPVARRAAVSTLAWLNDERSELILRMKIHAGDPEPDIVGQCFSALMQISPESSLPFVARYLGSSDDAIAEGAALALGESRLPEAFGRLESAWEGQSLGHRRKALLLPMALHRSEEAFSFLLGVIRDERPSVAAAAVDAVALFAADADRARAVTSAVESRSEVPVRDAFRRAFPE